MKWELISNIDYRVKGVGQVEYTYRMKLNEGRHLYRHVIEDIDNEDQIVRRTETMVYVPGGLTC